MIKSWISFLLPNDEYKRQRILHFFAEGSILLLIYLGLAFTTANLTNWNLDLEVILGLAIVLFISYTFVRYTLSGIEYTDISTDKQYKKERNSFVQKSIIFGFTFFAISLFFIGSPEWKRDWIETLSISIIASLLLFLINYISLKRSFKNNKDVMGE